MKWGILRQWGRWRLKIQEKNEEIYMDVVIQHSGL